MIYLHIYSDTNRHALIEKRVEGCFNENGDQIPASSISAYSQGSGFEILESASSEWPPPEYEIVDGEIVKKGLAALVAEGLENLPTHQKLVDGEILPKTQIELITDGLETLPAGTEIQDGEIVPIGSTKKRRDRAKAYIDELSPEGDSLTSIGDTLDAIIEYLALLQSETAIVFPDKLGQLYSKIINIKGRIP